MINVTAGSLIMAVVTAVLGMVGVSSSLIGYLVDHSTRLERIAQFLGGILMIIPGIWTDLPGFVIFLLVVFLQYRRKKQRKNTKAQEM